MNPNSALKAVVSGRVQMVMYRDFTLRAATRNGIVGEVQNMQDGTVHVSAEGEKEKLDAFVVELHKGSFLSRVDSVAVEWKEPTQTFTQFTVRY